MDVPGATGSTYLAGAKDVGFRLQVVVTGTNEAGTTEALSNLTAPVKEALPSVAVTWLSTGVHRLTVRARSLACAPCLAELRLRIRGSWRTVRMSRLPSGGIPGLLWEAKAKRLPRGWASWYVRVEDLDRDLRASSPTRTVFIP